MSTEKTVRLGKKLTAYELGKLFLKLTGCDLGSLTINDVFDWAEAKTDTFRVTEDGYIHLIINSKEEE